MAKTTDRQIVNGETYLIIDAGARELINDEATAREEAVAAVSAEVSDARNALASVAFSENGIKDKHNSIFDISESYINFRNGGGVGPSTSKRSFITFNSNYMSVGNVRNDLLNRIWIVEAESSNGILMHYISGPRFYRNKASGEQTGLVSAPWTMPCVIYTNSEQITNGIDYIKTLSEINAELVTAGISDTFDSITIGIGCDPAAIEYNIPVSVKYVNEQDLINILAESETATIESNVSYANCTYKAEKDGTTIYSNGTGTGFITINNPVAKVGAIPGDKKNSCFLVEAESETGILMHYFGYGRFYRKKDGSAQVDLVSRFFDYPCNVIASGDKLYLGGEMDTISEINDLLTSKGINDQFSSFKLGFGANTNSHGIKMPFIFSRTVDELLAGEDGKNNYITCWGDSLTQGRGWTDKLQELSGMVVYVAGTGGEGSETITARQGADVMITNNITIPAGITPVTIARRDTDHGIDTFMGNKALPLLQGGSGHVNPVKINDIEGTLAWTGSNYADPNGTWTFTRSTSGSQEVISRPAAIRTITDREYNDPYLMVIFMGENGGYNGNIDVLIRQHRHMIEHAHAKNFLVLGLSTGTAESRATYEEKMKAEFGRYFLSLREYLSSPIYENGEIVSCYGLDDQGLEPDPAFIYDGKTTLEEIALGMTPHQILIDSTHYTEGTKEIIGDLIYRYCCELNIF